MRVAAADASALAGLQRDKHLAAPALDPAQAESARLRLVQRGLERAGGQALENGEDEAQRFVDLLEANAHAIGDVSRGMHHLFHREIGIRRAREVGAQVECLAAPASREAGEPELAGELGRNAPGGEEAVLEARMLIEDVVQRVHLGGERRDLPRDPHALRLAEVGLDPPGHDAIHHEAMAEGLSVEPQPVFLEAHELREGKREAAIVAERPEVAEMVRDALALEHESAEPAGARRRRQAERRFGRLRVGPRVGDSGISRDAPREPVTVGDAEILEVLVGALVGIAEALLKPQHLLTHDREAEMPRLDDARVDRADGDLVHALAINAHEGVVLGRVFARGGGVEVAPQRKFGRAPAAVAQPRAAVGSAFGGDAQQVEQRALHAPRRGKVTGDVRIARDALGDRQLEHDKAFLHRVCRRYREAFAAIAIVGAPERHDPSVRFARGSRRGDPVLGEHARVRGRHLCVKAMELDRKAGDLHQPRSFAACWYQAAR